MFLHRSVLPNPAVLRLDVQRLGEVFDEKQRNELHKLRHAAAMAQSERMLASVACHGPPRQYCYCELIGTSMEEGVLSTRIQAH